MNHKQISFAFFAAILSSTTTFASGDAPKVKHQELHPAKRYSGNTPIDMTHGIPFNNGTFGLPNAEHEAWAHAPTIVPGLSEKIYPFADRKRFVEALEDRLQFFKAAIWNWQQTSEITKPEAIEYSKAAIDHLQPFVEKLADATKRAAKVGQDEWDGAQAEARKAMVDVYGLYTRLHHNVAR